MSQNAFLVGGLLLLVIGLALALGARPYSAAKKLTQPLVQFSLDSWQVLLLLWALFQAALGAALLVAGGAIVVNLGMDWYVHWKALLITVGLLLIAWWQFPGIRLLWTYWRHDGRASLAFYQEQQVATYCNRGYCRDFTLASVVELTVHYPRRSRAASADYSYTVLTFADNSELIVTSLLCDYASLRTLLPAAKTEAVQQRYAWLPADSLSRRLFGPFFG